MAELECQKRKKRDLKYRQSYLVFFLFLFSFISFWFLIGSVTSLWTLMTDCSGCWLIGWYVGWLVGPSVCPNCLSEHLLSTKFPPLFLPRGLLLSLICAWYFNKEILIDCWYVSRKPVINQNKLLYKTMILATRRLLTPRHGSSSLLLLLQTFQMVQMIVWLCVSLCVCECECVCVFFYNMHNLITSVKEDHPMRKYII